MLAPSKKWQPVIRQVQGDTPGILSNILENDVNLAIWQRQMPAHIEDFAALLLSLGEPLAEYLPLNVDGGDIEPDLRSLAVAYADVKGYEGFIADVAWLVSAYACLLGARCVGLRLRALDSAMCPRFHVDHVPVRLITTYAGIGSQWLKEGLIDRQQLGNPLAEPEDARTLRQINCGDVALLKGERWIGNEGYGLVHRSPPLRRGERRLLLSLDWLA